MFSLNESDVITEINDVTTSGGSDVITRGSDIIQTHRTNNITHFTTEAPPIVTEETNWKEIYHYKMGVTFAITLGLLLLTLIVFLIYYRMKKVRQIQGERQIKQDRNLWKVKNHGTEKLRRPGMNQTCFYENGYRSQELNAQAIDGGPRF